MQATYANPNPNPDPNPDPNELEQAWRIFDPLLRQLEEVARRGLVMPVTLTLTLT